MEKYVKVAKTRGEKTRRKLLEKGFYDKMRRVENDGDYIYFPVTGDVADFETIEREGRKVKVKPHSIRDVLKEVIPQDLKEHIPSSFDVIGDIAVIELPNELIPYEKEVAHALLKAHSHIKTVGVKESMVDTQYRTRKIKIVAGDPHTETIHKEYGCRYKLDVENSYFSPRSGTERKRVVDQMREGERVLVLFAGVGPFAILAAKQKKVEVVAVELNPEAVNYLRHNVQLNNVDVEVVAGDAKNVTPTLGKFDRVIMPLPKDAGEFLDVATKTLNSKGVIHYYTFKHDLDDAEKEVRDHCKKLGTTCKINGSVYCGSYSPCLSRICVDFTVD